MNVNTQCKKCGKQYNIDIDQVRSEYVKFVCKKCGTENILENLQFKASNNPKKKKRPFATGMFIRSIRAKLLLAFLLLSLVPLLLIGLTATANVKRMGNNMVDKVSLQLTEKTKNMLSNAVEAHASRIELLIMQSRNDIQMLAHHAGNSALLAARIKNPANWMNSQEKAILDTFYEKIQSSRPEMSNIRLFYKDGYAACRLHYGDSSLIDSRTNRIDYKGDKIWFKRTMDVNQVSDDTIYISAINIARNNNKTEIRYTMPVSVGTNREGLVIINYSAQAITDSLKNSKIGNDGYVFMIDKKYETAEGRQIAGGFYLSHPKYKICNENSPGTIVDLSTLKEDSGFTNFFDRSQDWTAAYRKVQIPGREWYIIAALPTAEMMQSVNTVKSGVADSVKKLAINFRILLALSVLLVFLVAMYLSSQITRPVKKLTELAEKVSMGDSNVSVNIKSNDEIGTLAHAFNRMVISLKILMNNNIGAN